MATQSFTLTSYDFTSAAGIRSWGSQVSAALQATGLTKTSDTGQINWTTTTTGVGYEMYRFNDTLQATAPAFLRIVYQASAGWLYISSITVSQTVDGAGGQGGLTSQMGYNGTAASQSSFQLGTGKWTFRFNYNSTLGFFGMTQWDDLAFGYGNSAWRSNYFVSRSCDTTGTPVGSGLLLQAGGATGSGGINNTISYDGNTVYSSVGGLVPGYNTYPTLEIGANVQFLRQQTFYPALRTHPQVLYYAANDLPRGTTLTLTPYSTSYTYITTGHFGQSSYGGYAMLWQ